MAVKSIIFESIKHILDDKSTEEGDWVVKYNKGPISEWRSFRVVKADVMMEHYTDSHFFTIKGIEDMMENFVAIKIHLLGDDPKLMKETVRNFEFIRTLVICDIPELIVGIDKYVVTTWCGAPVQDARIRGTDSMQNYLEGLDAINKIIHIYERFGTTPLNVLNVLWHKTIITISVDVGFDDTMQSINGPTLANILHIFIYGTKIRRTSDQFEFLVDVPIGNFMDMLLRKGMSLKTIKSSVDKLRAIYGTSSEQVKEGVDERLKGSQLKPVYNSSFFAFKYSTQVTDDTGASKTIATVCDNMKSFSMLGHFYMTLREYLDRFCYHDKIMEIISKLEATFGKDGVATLDLDGYVIKQEYPEDDREPLKIEAVVTTSRNTDYKKLIKNVLDRFNPDELFARNFELNLIANKAI